MHGALWFGLLSLVSSCKPHGAATRFSSLAEGAVSWGGAATPALLVRDTYLITAENHSFLCWEGRGIPAVKPTLITRSP